MPVKVIYTAHSSFERTVNIREFVRRAQEGKACNNEDPIPQFDKLLNWTLEHAFSEGVEFGKENPGIEVRLHRSPPEPE